MLPHSAIRCLGRSDLTPEAHICDLRHRCARHVQLHADLTTRADRTAYYPVMTGGECVDSVDRFMYLEERAA